MWPGLRTCGIVPRIHGRVKFDLYNEAGIINIWLGGPKRSKVDYELFAVLKDSY